MKRIYQFNYIQSAAEQVSFNIGILSIKADSWSAAIDRALELEERLPIHVISCYGVI
jgi:hypothetical protein